MEILLRLPRRALLLWLGMGVAGVVCFGPPSLPAPWTILIWLPMMVLGECFWAPTIGGRATLSTAMVAHLAALWMLPAREAVLFAVPVALAADLWLQRKPALKSVYNAALLALTLRVAGAVPAILGVHAADSDVLMRSIAFGIMAMTYWAVNRLGVTAIVSAAEGLRFGTAWRENFGSGYELLNASVETALAAIMVLLIPSVGPLGQLALGLLCYYINDSYGRRGELENYRRLRPLPAPGEAARTGTGTPMAANRPGSRSAA